MPELSISTEKVCFIAIKARQFDVKDSATDLITASNATDDGMSEVLEDYPEDPVRAELASFIRNLNVDEQVDLVTLARLGRGDADLEGWDELRAEAAAQHNPRTTARYLLGIPLLSDHLQEALSQLDRSCEEFETNRL